MKNKLYLLMGRSNCGKDTIFDMILNDKELSHIINVKQYTTRPIRENEIDTSYVFTSPKKFIDLFTEGEIIEHRQYNVLENKQPALWYYGTSKFDIDVNNIYLSNSHVLESASNLIEKYNDFVVPIYLYCDNAVLKHRALQRGDDVTEAMRRFSANKHDFRWLEHLATEGIVKNFSSMDDEIDYNMAKMVYDKSIIIDVTNKSREEIFNEVKNILLN